MDIVNQFSVYGRRQALVELIEIGEFISEGDRPYVSDIRIRASDETILIYVPRDKVAGKVKLGYTSLRQLGNLKKIISERYSSLVEVIFTESESHRELEAGFFQLLNRRFEDKVVSFHMSFIDEGKVDVWIECFELTDKLKSEIEAYFQDLLVGAALELANLNWLASSLEIPSIPVLLRLIKVTQPIDIHKLSLLLKKTYPMIQDKWLKNKLDTLRHKQLLIWQKPGLYALTSLGLSLVPTGTSRSSSDVSRALDLGRKKW
jgi:hypothetical protein